MPITGLALHVDITLVSFTSKSHLHKIVLARRKKRAKILSALKCGFKINMKLIWEVM